ncbi:hypothetical protein V5799_000952 [Amblyomma americanum]|uniref:Uncharacterized protein n=1 Tax=Amblyomma americanum TaxID=6943 RepID=A0AAQ4D1K9_AMBAM
MRRKITDTLKRSLYPGRARALNGRTQDNKTGTRAQSARSPAKSSRDSGSSWTGGCTYGYPRDCTMSRRALSGPRKALVSEGRTDLTPSSPPSSPSKKDGERRSLMDSGYDAGYTSMSCSTATEPDITKSTCSMLDSGLLEEEAHHSGDIKLGPASAKLDSGYIEPPTSALLVEADYETQLLEKKLDVRQMYAQDNDGDT